MEPKYIAFGNGIGADGMPATNTFSHGLIVLEIKDNYAMVASRTTGGGISLRHLTQAYIDALAYVDRMRYTLHEHRGY